MAIKKVRKKKGVKKGRMRRAMSSVKKSIGTKRSWQAHGSRRRIREGDPGYFTSTTTSTTTTTL